jgi:hypothetical protein
MEGGINLCKVFYVPSLKRNLIFVGCLTDVGHIVAFSDDRCWILNNTSKKRVLATGVQDCKNGLYKVTSSFTDVNVVEIEDAIKLWHNRFGHLNYIGLSHLTREDKIPGSHALMC